MLKTDVVVVNIDGVKDFMKKEFSKVIPSFTHMVVDECTGYKNPSAARTKAAIKLAKAIPVVRLMSGTPNPNSVTELYVPVYMADKGKRLGTAYSGFKYSVQTSKQVGPSPNMVKWTDKPGALEAVHALIADITVRHEFEKVMTNVPANHKNIKAFSLPAKAMKQYMTMEDRCLLEHQDGNVNAVHAAALRAKLLQIASGAVYADVDDAGKGDYVVIDRSRYEFIAELVENAEHSVTFFNWRHQKELLAEEFDKRGITYAIIDGTVKDSVRNDIVQRYQAGEYKTLLLHPKTGAHGLTLTRGTTTIISSPIYEADLLKQAIHRVYRGGQTKVTNTILVEARHTVEHKVYKRLDEKYTNMVDFLEMLERKE
jgi:hypothetical protein